MVGAEQGANSAVPFGRERFTAVPTGIGGCWPATLIQLGCFVRHEPNLSSGGQVVDIEIGAFLIAAGNGPEKQELLHLIGTLVRGPAATRS
jgi:hypothetical protein